MVIIDNRWEITAIPAATVVSFPYALGITIVFKPSGIAREQIAQVIMVFSIGIRLKTKTKINGKTTSLIIETI